MNVFENTLPSSDEHLTDNHYVACLNVVTGFSATDRVVLRTSFDGFNDADAFANALLLSTSGDANAMCARVEHTRLYIWGDGSTSHFHVMTHQ